MDSVRSEQLAVTGDLQNQLRTPDWARRAAKLFVLSAGGILLITGVAKIVSASGNSRILDTSDPIFAISFRHLLLFVGLIELAASAICLLRGETKLALFLVAWLASNFLLYHAGLGFLGWKPPCGCLGHLGDAIHLSPRIAEITAEMLSVYLLAGSVTSILGAGRSRGPNNIIGA
jgi:hypothetical protein